MLGQYMKIRTDDFMRLLSMIEKSCNVGTVMTEFHVNPDYKTSEWHTNITFALQEPSLMSSDEEVIRAGKTLLEVTVDAAG